MLIGLGLDASAKGRQMNLQLVALYKLAPSFGLMRYSYWLVPEQR